MILLDRKYHCLLASSADFTACKQAVARRRLVGKRLVGINLQFDLVAFALVFCSIVGCKQSTEESNVAKDIASTEKNKPIDNAKPEYNVAAADSILDHVLVIENTSSPTSIRIARYYMEKRGVKKVLQVSCPDSFLDASRETLDFATFQVTIERPLREYLSKDTQIDYIVLNKGIPIRLSDAPVGLSNNRPSLDSYIAALDYFTKSNALKVVIDDSGYTGKCFVNRFFNASERFSHAKYGGYLVTRLDGYTVESALALRERAISAGDLKRRKSLEVRRSPRPRRWV